MARELTFTVYRFDPEKETRPHFDTFTVKERPYMNVLEALMYIMQENDGSLAFRYSCRGAVCGSCAMSINGKIALACRTQTKDITPPQVRVEPLPRLPAIKDLVVDMEFFWRHYRDIRPWLIPEEPAPEKERLMSAKELKKVEPFINCILCGACYASCPVVTRDRDFLGPAILAKVYRFLADPRDVRGIELLEIVNSQQGVWGCDTIFNCVRVCPKDVRPTDAIVATRKRLVGRLFRFLGM
ncbi:MAG: succinate dehydrogenase/fumarate reductase iron-sulfur subunit [bacterium]